MQTVENQRFEIMKQNAKRSLSFWSPCNGLVKGETSPPYACLDW